MNVPCYSLRKWIAAIAKEMWSANGMRLMKSYNQ